VRFSPRVSFLIALHTLQGSSSLLFRADCKTVQTLVPSYTPSGVCADTSKLFETLKLEVRVSFGCQRERRQRDDFLIEEGMEQSGDTRQPTFYRERLP
jgi:hypothetical protein